jgi:hypothetical protein
MLTDSSNLRTGHFVRNGAHYQSRLNWRPHSGRQLTIVVIQEPSSFEIAGCEWLVGYQSPTQKWRFRRFAGIPA